MSDWLTHTKRIVFYMDDMHVIWHAIECTEQNPIISGNDESLFIIDDTGKHIYTLSHGVLVKTKIVFIKKKQDKTHLFFTRHDIHETHKLKDLNPIQWSHLMYLVKSCKKSRRWLMREQMNYL